MRQMVDPSGPCRTCLGGQGALAAALAWRRRNRCGCRCPSRGCLATLLLLAVLGWLLRMLIRHREREKGRFEPPSQTPPRGRPEAGGQRVPAAVYRRPDPLIYSQAFLMAQGLGVTWDNPDVSLLLGGTEVEAHNLAADTTYEIVARVWNGSLHAPAVGLPVRFAFLDFGVGTVPQPIGTDHVDLPVKGAAGSPALARVPWTTPATPGHYCLSVELVWPDDANPDNNVGQQNTTVSALNSPRARFAFAVRNDASRRRVLFLEPDGYVLGARPQCPPERGKPEEGEERSRHARARHAREAHPLPEGWTVTLQPRELLLESGEQVDVEAEVVAPDGFSGRQAINVNAFADGRLAGGVTLYAEGTA